jgi:hypothetical protein
MSNKIEEDKRALKASIKLSNSLAKQLLNVREQVIELTKERDELKCYVNTVKKPSIERYEQLEKQLKESQEELERVKGGIPFIFEKGANALYGTISSETGNCNDIPLFNKLKKEAIEQLLNK